MDLIASGQVIHAGTYNSNPVVIAAGLATVRHLKNNQTPIYSHLRDMGERLRVGLRWRLEAAGMPAHVGGIGPVIQVSMTSHTQILNYRDWAERDTAAYQQIALELMQRGVRTIARGTWYISTAHTENDIDLTLNRFEAALSALKPLTRS